MLNVINKYMLTIICDSWYSVELLPTLQPVHISRSVMSTHWNQPPTIAKSKRSSFQDESPSSLSSSCGWQILWFHGMSIVHLPKRQTWCNFCSIYHYLIAGCYMSICCGGLLSIHLYDILWWVYNTYILYTYISVMAQLHPAIVTRTPSVRIYVIKQYETILTIDSSIHPSGELSCGQNMSKPSFHKWLVKNGIPSSWESQ